MTDNKQYHFVVMYDAKTGQFEMDYDSLSTKFPEGSVWNQETEEWERVVDSVWEDDNSMYNRSGDALADAIRELKAYPEKVNKIDQQELYKWCSAIYEKHGQSAVFDFILENHHDQPWEYCEPCEMKSPVTEEADSACLVCGTVV